MNSKNNKIVDDFGDEWEKFNQIDLDEIELLKIYNDYFDIFPWHKISKKSLGIDVGCGSGRWAKFSATKVKSLTLLDGSSKSIAIAKKLLKNHANIDYIISDVTAIPINSKKYDFAYSLGVLHHVPDIDKALSEIYRILKPGAPFLAYLYYSFENEDNWYKYLWRISDIFRKKISNLNKKYKTVICEIIAFFIYLPLARLSLLLVKLNVNIKKIPLSYYRNKSYYTMRTDALDRFGTSYEKRYSKSEITQLLKKHVFKLIKFSSLKPYWCVVSYKKKNN